MGLKHSLLSQKNYPLKLSLALLDKLNLEGISLWVNLKFKCYSAAFSVLTASAIVANVPTIP